MELLLKKNVDKLGMIGDVVKVKEAMPGITCCQKGWRLRFLLLT